MRQKQEKIGFRRKVGYSAGGDLMMMCTNQKHMLLLSPRACTCFFLHQQTNSIRLSAHNCQLISTLCRSTMCHHIKHHQPECGTEIHDTISCSIAFRFIVWRCDPNTIAGREPQSWPVRRAHRRRPSNWVLGLTKMSRLNESWLIQHGSWIYSLVTWQWKIIILNRQCNAMHTQTFSIW